jgi:cytochrome c-type biogenesis protein CcmF
MAFVEALLRRGRRRFGSYIVHFGMIVVFVAIAVSSTMQVSGEFQLDKGESATIGAYTLTFLGAREVTEPHREAIVSEIAVSKNGRSLGTLEPRMNYYERQREPIGTPEVRTSMFEDLYLSIMNVDPMRQTLGLHALINPLVGWIWIATGLVGLGALITLFQGRRSQLEISDHAEAESRVTGASIRSASPKPQPGEIA